MESPLKNRIKLAELFNELGFKVGAEVGVLGGGYATVLCEKIPGLKLFLIDKWGLDEIRYRKYHQRKLVEAQSRLANYNCEYIRKFSMEAVKDFADESLDFVFIDADHHYHNVKDDIREWTKKVRKGGIVSGHDYKEFKFKNPGVMEAVDEYVKEHGLKLELTEWDMTQHNKDHRIPCWYFKI
jgi:SAM-dependent methyltransferase